MFIYKCDICKKEIKDGHEKISVGVGYSSGQTFCAKCGKPIVAFLKKHDFIEREKK